MTLAKMIWEDKFFLLSMVAFAGIGLGAIYLFMMAVI